MGELPVYPGINELVSRIINKLLPKQVGWASSQDSALIDIADFVRLSGISYEVDGQRKEEFLEHLGLKTKWALERSEWGTAGRNSPVDWVLDICNLGIAGYHLRIPYKADGRLLPILDFEFYHHNYEENLERMADLPILDLIYFCQLNGVDLKQKRENNPLYAHCRERVTRMATKEDIEKFVEEPDTKKIFLMVLENPENGVISSADFLTPTGELLYVGKPPQLPRKEYSLDDVQRLMGVELGTALAGYTKEDELRDAESILYRRNRVRGFLGSDINIPNPLVEHHREYFGEFDIGGIRERVNIRINSYNPSSISYGLDIPENFTLQEYGLFRYIQRAVLLARKTTLIYDTPEKRQLLSPDVFEIPSRVLEMGYEETARLPEKVPSRH